MEHITREDVDQHVKNRSRQNLLYSDIPICLREAYITTGYRPIHQSWGFYLQSIFNVHNETLNIWTHIIGAFVILYKMLMYSTVYDIWTDSRIWPVELFGVCCLFTHVFSVIAHTLHSKSISTHYFVFLVDYIGIALHIYGTCVMAIYSCSDKDAYAFLIPFYMPLLVCSCWLNYVILCFAKINFGECGVALKRRIVQMAALSLQAVLGTLPFTPRYIKCYQADDCSLASLNHISVNYLTIAIAAFFFASHVPERLRVRKFDIIGQGHQIFHVVATFTQTLQMSAVHQDIQNAVAKHAHPEFGSLLTYFASLFFALLTFLIYVKKYIPQFHKSV